VLSETDDEDDNVGNEMYCYLGPEIARESCSLFAC
jgi:hypothetical protein